MWGDVGWRSIVGLAAAVVAVVALFGIGVLLPYFVNDLHRLPLAELVDRGAYSEEMWPQNGWGYIVALAGALSLFLGPAVLVAVIVTGAIWLASLWRRRPEPGRLSRSLAVIVIMAGSVAAVLFRASETGSILVTWWLD